MKNLTDVEKMLLDNASIDELIKLKMEQSLREELNKKPTKNKIVTDIKDAPQNLIFSKKSVFKLFNKETKTETFINGIQAEGLLGLQNNIREKIKNKELDSFSTENTYIKFHSIKITG